MNQTNTDAKPTVMHRNHRKRTLKCGYVDPDKPGLGKSKYPPPSNSGEKFILNLRIETLLFVKGTLLPGCIFTGYNFS